MKKPAEYFLLIQGESQGPYTFEQLRELWLQNEIPLDTFYVRRGMPEVRPFDEIINRVISYQRPEPKREFGNMLPDRISFRLAALIVVSIAAVFALLHGVKAVFFPEHKPLVTVQATVQITPVVVRICNNDFQDWTNKVVRLNDGEPGAYQMVVRRLEAGKTADLPLIGFKNGMKMQFQPWGETVSEVWIGGSGHDFKRFVQHRL